MESERRKSAENIRGNGMRNVVVCLIHLSRLDCTKKCISHLLLTKRVNLRILLLIQGPQTPVVEEYFKTLPPNIVIIRSPKNIGSCRGRPILVGQAKQLSPDYVLILDNDIYVPPNWFVEMEKTWLASPANIAAVGMILDYGKRVLGGFEFGINPVTRVLKYNPIPAPYDYDIVCDAPLDGAMLIPTKNLHLYRKDPKLYSSNYHGFDMLLSIQKMGYKFIICSGFTAPHISKPSTEYASIRFKRSNPKHYQYFCEKWAMKMNKTQYLKIALATHHPALWTGIAYTLSTTPGLVKIKEYVTIHTAMAQNTRKMIKHVGLPLIFLLLLIGFSPLDTGAYRISIPWFIEWGGDNPGFVATSLAVIYGGLILVVSYVLMDNVPLIWVLPLSSMISLFASDYWETPMFVIIHVPHYQEEIVQQSRHWLSFLWSSSLSHLCYGIVSALLLRINWSKTKILIFLSAPWVMWIINMLLSIPITITSTEYLKLGIFGQVTPGVAQGLHNRIVCWAAILYLVSGSKWRGLSPIVNFSRGVLVVLLEGQFIRYSKWVLRFALKGNWALGTEMAFWDEESKKYHQKEWMQPMHDDIRPAVDDLKKVFNEEITVLELGPGPKSRLTEGFKQQLFDLVAVDPLADTFKKHLGSEEFLTYGYGETMDKLFPPESFHMSYASNALDHTEDPSLCFKNMVSLTKVNGYIMIQGGVNEGTRANWLGLHKHNMWIEREELLCCSRYGVPVNLSRGYPLEFVDSRQALIEGNPWFSITYRKVSSYE